MYRCISANSKSQSVAGDLYARIRPNHISLVLKKMIVKKYPDKIDDLDRELGRVRKWFQGWGWKVKIQKGMGEKNIFPVFPLAHPSSLVFKLFSCWQLQLMYLLVMLLLTGQGKCNHLDGPFFCYISWSFFPLNSSWKMCQLTL